MTSATNCRVAVLALVIVNSYAVAAQETALQIDPAKTSVSFTLGAVLHSVNGTFRVKQSTLLFDAASGLVSGEIIVDAKSGDTGNGLRDRKMHKDVLESESYPLVSFHPDRLTGAVAAAGKSSVMVHGTFGIHGVDREITIPAEVEMAPDRWTARVHFTIPYAKWGMKNPSNLFLHVSDSVDIDVTLAGSAAQGSTAAHN